ncbi:MAG TPA: cupin domain-containing protein [Terriglobales bacterium]|nr:cupin domain-containing protein [Terriglobales bacterium]
MRFRDTTTFLLLRLARFAAHAIRHPVVGVDPLFDAPTPARVLGAGVTFEPGARTAWHTHPLGQTLIVTAGCGRVQRWGGPIEEIRPRDVVWFAPAPTAISFVFGGLSGATEIAAVVMFMLLLYRTARQSIEPHNPYEKFIASSFVWFLLGTILEAGFFFAKATAHSEHSLIMRIALIDSAPSGYRSFLVCGPCVDGFYS